MSFRSLNIRPAVRADLAVILDIEKSCRTVTWSAESFAFELAGASNINLVAQAGDGTVCGFVFSVVAADELEINTLAVRPAFQRQGIAQHLLAAAAQTAYGRGAAFIHLEVRSKNTPAFNLYRKMGFEVRWIRKQYYSDDGDDAIVMSSDIPFT